jgi:predicted O-methyltransferase YrrM
MIFQEKMRISQSVLDAVDLSQFAGRFVNDNDREEFFGAAGQQHYRLLAWLSTQFYGKDLIDIGTHRGSSALAMSYSSTNTVHTFDIDDRLAQEWKMTKWANRDIQFHHENLWEPATRAAWRDRLLAAPVIFMDIDPHDGPMELEFYQWLKTEGYQGLLICDDVWYFKGMRDAFWYHIPEADKTDATLVGHWSGTGIVHFGHQVVEVVERAPSRALALANAEGKSYTAVTAYFNLAKRPDASAEIKARPQAYYMQHANMTMALPINLVVFCDPDSKPALEAMRPAHLKAKTHWIVMEFGDFELVQANYEFIAATREAKGYKADPRNTVSYYLFCMLRYVMLQQAMAENVFGSTHFSWVNICIERMGWKSGVVFPLVWSEFRDKFSTCYIDYQPRKFLANLEEYYRWGRCGMCSGFFTGSKHYMSAFCEAVLTKFAEMTARGLGHADEQLFSLVFFDHPDIFEFYLGDYTEMIVNYGWVRNRASEPVKNVIGNLAVAGENWPLLDTLCQRWLDSVQSGCCKVPHGELEHVKVLQGLAKRNMSM